MPQTDDTRLIGATIYLGRPNQHQPTTLPFEDWTPTPATTETELREFAAKLGLQVHSKVEGQYIHFVFNSGASAVYDEGCLHSIRFWRADKGARRRQMSVSLPESTLDQLRMRAQQEHISVQKLIEQVLSTTA